MVEKTYKVSSSSYAKTYPNKAECDFWFDPLFYRKNGRLKLSDKEKERREAIKLEKNKFK